MADLPRNLDPKHSFQGLILTLQRRRIGANGVGCPSRRRDATAAEGEYEPSGGVFKADGMPEIYCR
ncbi:MAG: hypothetical protein ABI216_12590 [Devosia sp.]